MNPRFGFLFALLFVVAGCQSVPPAQPTGLSPESFWKDQKARATAWKYLGGRIDLSLHSPKEKMSGGGRFLIEPPDRLYLDIRDPFGRTHYVLASDQSAFVAHYPRNRIAYQDNARGRHYFTRFLGIGFTSEELIDLWRGVIPPSAGIKSFQTWEWDATARGYRATRGNVTAIVDGHSAALTRLELEIGGDRVIVTYSDAKPCCGESPKNSLARSVEVETGNSATKLELGMESLTLAAPPGGNSAFRVSLPPDTQKILLNK